MGTVHRVVNFNNHSLSEESVARLNALDDRPIDYSDIPELTDQEVADIKRKMDEGKNRQMFSLRLQKKTIEWWRDTIGAGYSTAMGKLLDEARRHPEWIMESLKSR